MPPPSPAMTDRKPNTREAIEAAIVAFDSIDINDNFWGKVSASRDALHALLDTGLEAELQQTHEEGFDKGKDFGAAQMRERCAQHLEKGFDQPMMAGEIRNLPLRANA